MAVQFKMVAKQNNLVSPPEVKYYPCAVHQGETNLDMLASFIADSSTMSRADCYGVIMALTEAISYALKQGQIVRIDNLGTFQLTLQGTAADDPEALGKSTIKDTRIVYRPAASLKRDLKTITFKRMR
ncbi:HU family DNA-binding protein [Flavobacterium sp.]|uniref:HU family DNA-binding protein n=1 Tax=Flavobacterium sp. TaxID=239 RepID=UPI002FD884C0